MDQQTGQPDQFQQFQYPYFKCEIPGCDSPIIVTCMCPRRCSICEDGHKFHWRMRHGLRFHDIHKGWGEHADSNNCCKLNEQSDSAQSN
ncbi:MAG: hypothetical protein HYT61_02485 [Candidatus Yanofskybacteria bacterium]|nr:hypothetical protein [Candidatus Yanofskybacteria bacterium]